MQIAGIAAALALVVSCGGPKSPPSGGGGEDNTAKTEPSERDKALAKLKRQQNATCGPMCELITDCAVEDAKAKMTPEALAELKLEQTAPMHTEKCVTDCEARDLSPRQIQTMRDCITGYDQCSTYVTCLKQAKPQPAAKEP